MNTDVLNFQNLIATPTPLRRLENELFLQKEVEVWLKEDYRTHSEISGNKFRKLKYNLQEAKRLKKNRLLSFGGAYSNHIHALAAAGKLFGFETAAIIRGDELNETSGHTLRFAYSMGMKLQFADRTAYRDKAALAALYDSSWYLIPEGGSNSHALKGCAEMMTEILNEITPTHFCLSAGTGGTAAGILTNEQYKGQLEVFPALKNGLFLQREIESLCGMVAERVCLHTGYHFGGYGKINSELSKFIEYSEQKFNTPLDPVYTGKLFFGVLDLVQKGYFLPGSRIVIYHSGGLQGKLSG